MQQLHKTFQSKKIILFIAIALAYLVAFALPARVQANPAVLSLTPSKASVAQGEAFTVQAKLNTNGSAVSAAVVKLNFSTTRLQYTGVSSVGSPFTTFGIAPAVNGGSITVFLFDITPTAHTDSLLITINFKALTTAGDTTVSLASSTQVGVHPSGDDIYSASSTNAAINIQSSPTPAPAPTTQKADLNNDGNYNASDLSLFISRYKAKNSVVDYNGDGNYNASDLSLFINYFKTRS